MVDAEHFALGSSFISESFLQMGVIMNESNFFHFVKIQYSDKYTLEYVKLV